MPKYPVVSSREELEIVLTDLRKVMNLSVRLPDFPFLSEVGTDSFCQDHQITAFEPILEALALQYQDSFVSGARIDPHYQLDDADMRGTFSAFHIPPSQIANQYQSVMTYEWDDNPAEAMANYWNVLCMAGSSGSWAIWAERMMGIVIVRTIGSDVSWRNDSDWFLPAREAVSVFIGQEFYRTGVPEDLRQNFLRNVRPIGDS